MGIFTQAKPIRENNYVYYVYKVKEQITSDQIKNYFKYLVYKVIGFYLMCVLALLPDDVWGHFFLSVKVQRIVHVSLM